MEQNNPIGHYLVFTLSDKQFALPLESVERVVHAAAVTLVPHAPEIVCGLINYHGFIMPVLNISRRFQLPHHAIHLDNHFVIVHTADRDFALVADTVPGVMARKACDIVKPAKIIAGMQFLAGVLTMENGMMLIPDLENLLTYEEQGTITALMSWKKDKTKIEKTAGNNQAKRRNRGNG